MKNRTYKNWATAWLLMNENPDDLDEYLELKPQMADFHERVKLMTKTEEKVEAEAQWKRYKELEARCEKLLVAKSALERVKEACSTRTLLPRRRETWHSLSAP